MERKIVSGRKLVLFTALGSITLLAVNLRARDGMADAVVMAGKVVSVEGKVLIRQDGSESGQAVAMKPGLNVKEGDVINTASDGKAKILLEDKTILDIGSSALFKVQKFEPKHGGDRNVDLSMPYGTTRVSVSKPIAAGGKFQIRTRTATMGVRGTEFVIQSDLAPPPSEHNKKDSKDGGKGSDKAPQASQTKITVIQGKVEVVQKADTTKLPGEARKPAAGTAAKKDEPVMLTAGTQLTASSDKPAAKPVTLDAAQLSAVSSSTKVQDNTFQKAVTLDLKGESIDSGAGQATRLALKEAISAPQNQAAPILSTNGFAGVPSPQTTTMQIKVPAGGGVHKIHVVVIQ